MFETVTYQSPGWTSATSCAPFSTLFFCRLLPTFISILSVVDPSPNHTRSNLAKDTDGFDICRYFVRSDRPQPTDFTAASICTQIKWDCQFIIRFFAFFTHVTCTHDLGFTSVVMIYSIISSVSELMVKNHK